MMGRKFARLLLVFAVLAAGLMPAVPAFAATPPPTVLPNSKDATCAKAPDSVVCKTPESDPLTGKDGVIHKATEIIAIIAGAGAMIVIVLSGIKYITSAGDPEGVGKAKKTLIYAAVGLVLIVVGQAIINLVIGGI